MNKIGSLESQLMDSFKEKEEKEAATTAADAQKIQDKEIEARAAKILAKHKVKFNDKWRQKNKKKKKMAKASRRNNK